MGKLSRICTCNDTHFIDMMCRHCLMMIRHAANDMTKDDESYQTVVDQANHYLKESAR